MCIFVSLFLLFFVRKYTVTVILICNDGSDQNLFTLLILCFSVKFLLTNGAASDHLENFVWQHFCYL